MQKVEQWGRWKISDLTKENMLSVIDLLENEIIDGLSLSTNHGFDCDFSILDDLPSYKGLVVSDSVRVNFQSLPRLNELRFLSLGDRKLHPIDFNAIPNLEEYRGNWYPQDILPQGSSPLRHLALWGYKPKSRDLTEFADYEHLEELELTQANIENLDGVPRFFKLHKFEAAYCRALSSVAALISSSVETVELESCGKIQDIDILKKCEHLKKLRVSRCGNLKSLKFLEESKSINWFSFVNTNVEDGDMRPLFNLNYAGFIDKRHFSHTVKQVKEIIATRLATYS